MLSRVNNVCYMLIQVLFGLLSSKTNFVYFEISQYFGIKFIVFCTIVHLFMEMLKLFYAEILIITLEKKYARASQTIP